jgi:anti-anti-sigma factor
MDALGFEVLPAPGGNDITLVRVAGRVQSGTVEVLQEQLNKLIHDGSSQLVLDLAQVTFLSSAGMRTLLAAAKTAHAAGGALKVAALRPEVKHTLLLTGFQHAFGIHEDVAEAVAAF